jgi:hypothetical protein
MKKAANEAIGTKKKYRRKRGLGIWNEEIKNAIENKRTGPTSWSSGRGFRLLIMRSRVRFPDSTMGIFPGRGKSPW